MVRSSFFEFNVARSAMFGARSALQVTGHNMANAATQGFSRQFVKQQADHPMTYWCGRGMFGTGVTTLGVGQHRNIFLDTKFWGEQANLGRHNARHAMLGLMETTNNPLSPVGLSGAVDTFFASLQSLHTEAGGLTHRTNVLRIAETLTEQIRNTARSYQETQLQIDFEVRTTVASINSLAKQIANLNEQIDRFELAGDRANDLRDQRARLIDHLSTYVNTDVFTEVNGEFTVLVNGQRLLNGSNVTLLRYVERETPNNPMDAHGLVDVYIGSAPLSNVHPTRLNGSLRGLLDVRDGNNGGDIWYSYNAETSDWDPNVPLNVPFKGIPHYMEKLNEMVRVLARAMNEGLDRYGNSIRGVEGHANGFDNYGIRNGLLLFTASDRDDIRTSADVEELGAGNTIIPPPGIGQGPGAYHWLNALNFEVNPALFENPNLLNTSDASEGGESNNIIIIQFLELREYPGMFREGKIGNFISGKASEMAVDVRQARNFTRSYTNVVAMVDNQRKSVSGVELNEEGIDLVRFQQVFNEAGLLMNAIDNIYNMIINGLGSF